jgi:hypothetical protein
MMKRRTVRSPIKIDTSPVEDCIVEPEDSYGKTEEAPATPALLVSSIKLSGVTAGSKIELTVQVLPDLYLETITLIRGGPAEATLGTLSQGTRKERGEASATISAELYDFVLSQARASTLLIALEHSETRITNIRFENI